MSFNENVPDWKIICTFQVRSQFVLFVKHVLGTSGQLTKVNDYTLNLVISECAWDVW